MGAARTRWIPVIGVVVAAPWFAEMAWGGYPATDIPVILLFLGPMYGGAALLVREIARRTGRGWPTMLLLAAAFGVLQAGVVDQSLFNPSYDRYDFQHPVHVGGIDISLYYLLAFVSGHDVASIATPIALAEAWSRHGVEPWLSRRAAWVVGACYVLASVVNHLGVKDEVGHGFQASPLQVSAALTTVLALVVVAVTWRRRSSTVGRVPPPWVLLVAAFAGYLLYLPVEDGRGVAVGLVVISAAVAAVGTWSRSRHWRDAHARSLVVGATLTGAVTPFITAPYEDDVNAAAERVADLAAATICLLVVAATLMRLRALRSGAPTSGP
jgi:hypothetical protein